MKIQEQDFYHGAALTQIAEHQSFKALNKGSKRYGHYLVNADCHVFVRYSKADGETWTFTFNPDQLEPINNVIKSSATPFLCLVCGELTICLLDQSQIEQVIDLDSPSNQWVRVQVPSGKSCKVSGSNGTLKRRIPHNAFPKKLFNE